MQRSIFTIIFLVVCARVFAQKADSSEFNIYKYKPTPKDRLVLEVNHTGWLGVPSEFEQTLFSGGVNLMLFFDHPIRSSHFSFAWGASISSYNIHGPFNLVYKMDTVSNKVLFTSLEKRTTSYNINRIGLKILEMPFEFRFRTFTDYQFKLSVGFKVGYVVHSFRKIYDANMKVKLFDIEGINPLRYGVTLRMGWEQIHLTAFYSLTEFFEKGKGTPGIFPFSLGFAYTPRISLGGK